VHIAIRTVGSVNRRDGDVMTNTETPTVDLYREVHKGLRLALSDLARDAGNLDPDDPSAVAAFANLFANVNMMLETHHRHEEIGNLGALLSEHLSPELTASIESAHVQADSGLARISAAVADLQAGLGDVNGLYDMIVAFVADYLTHMNVEERQVMPALRANAGVDDLMAITMQIRTSVPPPDMCVFLSYMLPAMNPDERTGTLGGMKMGAPPEIFDMFWAQAERSLSEADLAVVADRVGV